MRSEYKKFPAKKRKIMGNDRLWIGRDHLLLVESTGISEIYKRFFFKDIQAFHLVERKTNTYVTAVVIFLLLLTGAACLFGWNKGVVPLVVFFGVISLVLLFYVIRLLLRGPACDCWIYSSVQKEKLTPVNTIKIAKKFMDLMVPRIETVQGGLSSDVLAAGRERVTAGAGLKHAGNRQETISTTWHHLLFCLMILIGVLSSFTLFFRWPVLLAAAGIVYLSSFALSIIAMARQAGSILPGRVKTLTLFSMVLLVLTGISGYIEMIFVMVTKAEYFQSISYNSWEVIKLWSQLDPFELPLILGIDIFIIVSCLLFGILGLVSMPGPEK